MAVTTQQLEKKIQLKSNHGMADGVEKITTRTYGDVKSTATDQAVYDTALLIAGLQEPVLEEVIVYNLSLITPQ
ncbi:hypothetical protein DSECCO2_117870 [anaerobic digester metagenome]